MKNIFKKLMEFYILGYTLTILKYLFILKYFITIMYNIIYIKPDIYSLNLFNKHIIT